MKRYDIQAKRRDTDEKWSEWAAADDYKRACEHAAHAEEVGYSSRIVVKEKGIEELWEILDGDTEKADAIFDAGFRKKSEVAREIFAEIEKIRLKHTYGEIDEAELNIGLYMLKKRYIGE